MNAKERRSAILTRLRHENGPVSATALAKEHGVSRQIIVGDIALLRAGGEPISATPRGYLLDQESAGSSTPWPSATPPRRWSGSSRSAWTTAAPCWTWWWSIRSTGQLVGQLQLSSRYDVEQFLNRSRSGSRPAPQRPDRRASISTGCSAPMRRPTGGCAASWMKRDFS